MSMSAVVATRYGGSSAVETATVAEPSIGSGDVLVRVRASSLNPLDAKLLSGALRPFLRLRFPAVLGFDLAGEVVGLGSETRRFSVGERVYGRIDAKTGGAHAELAGGRRRVGEDLFALARVVAPDQEVRRADLVAFARKPGSGQADRERVSRCHASLKALGGSG